MTDYDRLIAFLDGAGFKGRPPNPTPYGFDMPGDGREYVVWPPDEDGDTCVRIGSGEGYSGFFSEWYFDPAGKLVEFSTAE
jgi:hypothetical protein